MHTITIPTSREGGALPSAVISATGVARRYGAGDTDVYALGGVSLAREVVVAMEELSAR
jgi:hypothetical protein